MAFDVNKLKGMFSKKTNNSVNEDIEIDEENDTSNNEIDEAFDDVEDTTSGSNSSFSSMSQEKKKKMMLLLGGVAGLGIGALAFPSILATFSNSSYENEVSDLNTQIQQENKSIEQKQPPLERPKREPIVQQQEPKPIIPQEPEINKIEPKSDPQVLENIVSDNQKINELMNNDKIETSKDLINGDNTEKLLDKIVTNSDKIKDVVDENLQLNINKSTKDLGTNIDPFLLESMVVVDNNYHKKVMLSQVEMMKEFMKYLDIKKKFDESIQEYKEGKVKLKSIEEKILDELKKFNLDSKLNAVKTEIEAMKDENDKLKFLIKEKTQDIENLSLKFNAANNTIKEATEVNADEVNDDKLARLLNELDVQSLSIYNINNRPIAEISKDGSFTIYKVGDIYEGFKIKALETDGMLISYVNSKGVEKTKFINVTKDLEMDNSFDVLKIPESNFNSGVSQVAGKNTMKTIPTKTNVKSTPLPPKAQPTTQSNTTNSAANKFLEKIK